MNHTYFNPATTSPDEKAIAEERNDLMHQIKEMEKELDALNRELASKTSDNSMLKDTIIRLAMKIAGTSN